MDAEKLKKVADNEYERQKSEVTKPVIMIAGASGSGKSSLINRIFGRELARTGSGAAVTKGCIRYEEEGVPVVIYDTEGYEVCMKGSECSNFYRVVLEELASKNHGELYEQVHAVWYTVSIPSRRVLDFDIEALKVFTGKYEGKVAFVITQCDIDAENDNGGGVIAGEFRNVLKEHYPEVPVFETSALSAEMRFDLDALLEWTENVLPTEDLRKAFVAAQIYSIEQKRKKALQITAAFAAGAGLTAGLNPFPVSDAILLIPQQMAMLSAISSVYGLDVKSEAIKAAVRAQLLSFFGKQIASSLVKFIPVFGQVINGTVAAALTGAVGAGITEMYAYEMKRVLCGEDMLSDTGIDPAVIEEYLTKGAELWKQKKADFQS